MRAEIVKDPQMPHPTEGRPLAVGDVIDVLPVRWKEEEVGFAYATQATRDDGSFRSPSFFSLSAEYVAVVPEMDLRRRGIIRSASFAAGTPKTGGGVRGWEADTVIVDDPLGHSFWMDALDARVARSEAETPVACTCSIADLMTRGCTCQGGG